MSRLISDLSPEMQPLCNEWCAKMDTAGIDYLITCTGRTQSEQEELYALGRTKPGKIVTWTLNSKHLTGDAFDFCIMFAGRPDWKMVQKDSWVRAVEIGRELGLTQVINKDGKVLEYAHLQRSLT